MKSPGMCLDLLSGSTEHRRTSRRSRTGSAPARTASTRSRTRRRTRRRCAASSTCRSGRRVGPGQLVDVGPVQVRPVGPRSRARARRGCRRRRCADGPDRRRSTPESACPSSGFARSTSPAHLDSHLPNWPSLTCSGYQVICWLSLDHAVTELGDLDEPRRHRPVDQRIAAAPAVRVGVLVGFVAQQHRTVLRDRPALVLQIADDLRVGVEHVLARVVRHRHVEAALGVDRRDRDDVAAWPVALSSSP